MRSDLSRLTCGCRTVEPKLFEIIWCNKELQPNAFASLGEEKPILSPRMLKTTGQIILKAEQ